MRAGGAKAKGNGFERQICKTLGESLFNDKEAFIRTPNSGALHTIRNIMGAVGSGDVSVSGDIMQVKHLEKYTFPYSIECKHWKEFKMIKLLQRSPKSLEYKAWQQALRDAESVEREPLLVFKENRGEVMVAIRTGGSIDTLYLEAYNAISNGTFTVMTLTTFLNQEALNREIQRRV